MLQEVGSLVIVTDNLPYLTKLVRDISASEPGDQALFRVTLPDGVTTVVDLPTIADGLPAGYDVGVSSSDRFWRSRQKNNRFYTMFTLVLRPESSSAAGPVDSDGDVHIRKSKKSKSLSKTSNQSVDKKSSAKKKKLKREKELL